MTEQSRPYTLPGFARELVNTVAGLLLWSVHLMVVYSVHALACARGFADVRVAGMNLVPFSIGLATALALGGCAAVLCVALRDLREARGEDDSVASKRFLTYTSSTIAGFSMLAIVWVALPALFVPACS
jgi:hypothetical protein